MAVKLFVGSLAYATTSERLREAFARYGVVQAATVMTDRETGRSRGFGFVEMSTPEEAEQALAGLNGASLDGRSIRVDKATPRGAPGSGPYRGPDTRPRPSGSGGPPRGYSPGPFGGGDRRPAGAEDQRGGGGRSFGGPPRGGAPRDGTAPPRGGTAPPRGAGARPDRGGKRGDKDRKEGADRRPGGRNVQRRSEDRGRRSMNEDGGYGRTRQP
jgi:RNA recognition motif-containing protein